MSARNGALAAAGEELAEGGFYFAGVESPNGTIFPDALIDRVMPHLSGAEFKVLAYIVRRTFGFKKECDAISLDQICNGITKRDGSVLDEGTGLARKTAVAAIQGLEGKGVIVCQRRSSPEKGNLPTTYALRFRGQERTGPGTKLPQGGNEMYPAGGAAEHQGSSVLAPGPGTELHPQPTVVQPTVQQGGREAAPKATERSRRREAGGGTTAAGSNLEAIWGQALARMAARVGTVSYQAWLAPARLRGLTGDTAVVEAPHALAQRWMERHLREAIAEELGAVTGRPLAVAIAVAGADG